MATNEEWKECRSKSKNIPYWFNKSTGESRWSPPLGSRLRVTTATLVQEDLMELDDLDEVHKQNLRDQLKLQRRKLSNVEPKKDISSSYHENQHLVVRNSGSVAPKRTPVFSYIVVDTNVLVGQLAALKDAFASYRTHTNPKCALVVPLMVLHELDRLKGGNCSRQNERRDTLSKYARQASHFLYEALSKGDGAVVGENMVDTNGHRVIGTVGESADDKIIECAIKYATLAAHREVVKRNWNRKGHTGIGADVDVEGVCGCVGVCESEVHRGGQCKKRGVLLLTEDVNMCVIAMSQGLNAYSLKEFLSRNVRKTEARSKRKLSERSGSESASDSTALLQSAGDMETPNDVTTSTPPHGTINSIPSACSSNIFGSGSSYQGRVNKGALTPTHTYIDPPTFNTRPHTQRATSSNMDSDSDIHMLGYTPNQNRKRLYDDVDEGVGGWVRVYGLNITCTKEQVKYLFKRFDASEVTWIGDSGMNEGEASVYIGPRYGGVSAAVEKHDGDDLMGKTVHVREDMDKNHEQKEHEKQSESVMKKRSATPESGKRPISRSRISRFSHNVEKGDEFLSLPTCMSTEALKVSTGANTFTDANTKVNISVNSSLDIVTPPHLVNVVCLGESELEEVNALIIIFLSLVEISLVCIFIEEFGLNIWEDMVRTPLKPWGAPDVLQLVNRYEKLIADHWPSMVVREGFANLATLWSKIKRLRRGATLDYKVDGIDKVLDTICVACQYILNNIAGKEKQKKAHEMKIKVLEMVRQIRSKYGRTSEDKIKMVIGTTTRRDVDPNPSKRRSLVVCNLELFRKSTLDNTSTDLSQLSPQYYLSCAKDVQMTLAEFIKGQIQTEINAGGRIVPDTALFLNAYNTHLENIALALQHCIAAIDQHIDPDTVKNVFASLATSLEEYLQTYSLRLPSPNPWSIEDMATGWQNFFMRACTTADGSAEAHKYVQYFLAETVAVERFRRMLST
eukprot:CFRG8220T1